MPKDRTGQKKCSGCRSWRSDFTRHATRCDRCTAPDKRHARFVELKSDRARYLKFLAAKRKAWAKKKARYNARFRPVEVEIDPDLFDETVAGVLRRERNERIQALRLRYEAGESTSELAESTGFTAGAIYKMLQDSGVKFRSRAEATRAAMLKWHAANKS